MKRLMPSQQGVSVVWLHCGENVSPHVQQIHIRLPSCDSDLKMCQLFELFSLADEKKDKASAAVSKAAKSEAASKLPTTPTKASKTNASAAASATPATPTSAQSAPATPLGVNLAKVDLGKISSILSSLTSAMKNTGVFCVGKRW